MKQSNAGAQWRHWWWAVLVAVALAVCLLAWLATLAFAGGGTPARSLPVPYSAELVKRGEYLARVGDCVACHTARGGAPFAGGLPMATPIGTLYSSNITPDPDTGIGSYSYGEFERALRRGIGRSGASLYPAMPYPSYARVSDEDVEALYAYFMRGVTPVRRANRGSDIPWPLSLRWPLTYWRWLFAPAVGNPVAATPTPLARGAYLVEGLGHCGACHSPRALTMQEKALGDDPGRLFLSGAAVDGWYAPSLRGEPASGLGAMSQADLVALLKTGRSEGGAIFGGMGEVVEHSTQYMDDGDLRAVASYLKSLAPTRQEQPLRYDEQVARELYSGNAGRPGAQLYVDNCATCHRTHGQGYAQTFPALALNPVVNDRNPDSLIHLVLAGGSMPGTREAPTQFAMPAFAERLSDREVAQILSFLRSSWGNQAPAVEERQVARMRTAVGAGGPVRTDYDPRQGGK
ncbi:cytochrome c [Pseudomonas delhiensis]|uniref:c-type cytochrome n=1 Tax=Pseudomonas delhiensis TaxID=366289 RepID=UPI00315AF5EE